MPDHWFANLDPTIRIVVWLFWIGLCTGVLAKPADTGDFLRKAFFVTFLDYLWPSPQGSWQAYLIRAVTIAILALVASMPSRLPSLRKPAATSSSPSADDKS